MKIPIIADLTKQLTKDYGCLLPAGIPLRGLFIISDKGMIIYNLTEETSEGERRAKTREESKHSFNPAMKKATHKTHNTLLGIRCHPTHHKE